MLKEQPINSLQSAAVNTVLKTQVGSVWLTYIVSESTLYPKKVDFSNFTQLSGMPLRYEHIFFTPK